MITKEQLFVQGELVASVGDIHNAQATLIPSLRAVLERPMTADPAAGEEVVDISSREITVMGGSAGRTWEHSVPKVARAGARSLVLAHVVGGDAARRPGAASRGHCLPGDRDSGDRASRYIPALAPL